MAEDYQHVMGLCREVLPGLDWKRIEEEWSSFDALDHGDNEPFEIMRRVLGILLTGEDDGPPPELDPDKNWL